MPRHGAFTGNPDGIGRRFSAGRSDAQPRRRRSHAHPLDAVPELHRAILRVLTAHGVDFVIGGGVCGVLHGAPIATFDLDVVHSRATGNIDRLLAALSELGAHARVQADRRVAPDRSHLESPGHQLLMTSAGPLDLPGALAHDRGYDDLVRHSTEVTVSGMRLRLLDLETLIETKEAIARDKDRAVLAILRRTLEEKRK